jgi:zinc transporter 1
MFTLTFLYMLAELIIGVKFNCMSLVADAFHMLSDVIALIIGYLSVTVIKCAFEHCLL